MRIASISSVSFIVPICAAKAEPERPATMIAVISTPSSRKREPPDQVDREDLGAELAQLHRALLGDDDADQEAHQPDDAERGDADQLELVDQRACKRKRRGWRISRADRER